MASRSVDDLLPEVAGMVRTMLAMCEQQNISVIVSCTYRSNAEQDQLYAQGRTEKGSIVTYLKGGQSKHNTRQAVDIYPLINGKLARNSSDEERKLWQRLGAIGKAAGLEWGGDWRMKDMPHFQKKG